jgi:hypothetical protein
MLLKIKERKRKRKKKSSEVAMRNYEEDAWIAYIVIDGRNVTIAQICDSQ